MSYSLEDYKKIGINTNLKAFKRYYKAGLLNDIDEQFLEDIQNYWLMNYGKTVDPLLHIAFSNLSGKKELRVIPPTPIMWSEIIPFFNDMNIRVGYSDKNIYDKLINPPRAAETIIKRIRGNYFNVNNETVNVDDVASYLQTVEEDIIVKPSNADNGMGIARLKYKNGSYYLGAEKVSVELLDEKYGLNFIIQKVVKQHEVMANPHPDSVNTLRMVTFRWKGEIHHLLTYARIGVNGDVRDNSAAGGICVGVKDDGEFFDYAIDKNLDIYKEHPTTHFSFSDMKTIPNYDKFKEYVVKLHENVLHHDFVSWDIIVGQDELPIFLELNFRGPTWIYQLATLKPTFGDLTEEVLQYVGLERKKNRVVKDPKAKLKSQNKKLKREVKELKGSRKELKSSAKQLKAEKEQLENEVEALRNKLSMMESSKSWRLTTPLRKIRKLYK